MPTLARRDERLYGLDWLRIIAFGLLILYHIGMFFVPWDWHVKTAQPLEWLELPMLALSPWRLPLLFVISGVASRILLEKMHSAWAYSIARSSRLLIPLAVGMIIFVAPQAWAEVQQKTGYGGGFWSFWLHHYFEFGSSRGLILPTYNHLWFVAYLWVYTLLLAALSLLPRRQRRKARHAFEASFRGSKVILIPTALLFFGRMVLLPAFGETHALVNDVYAHFVYGFCFFFGVGLARSEATWTAIIRRWKLAAVLGVAGYAMIVALDLTIAGDAGDLERITVRLARSAQAWCLIVALLGLARLHSHKDTGARRYLTEAIFPYYIAHQTIIVLTGHILKPYSLAPGTEFILILVATIAGCVATFELVRRIPILRPLFGLKPTLPRDRRLRRTPLQAVS